MLTLTKKWNFKNQLKGSKPRMTWLGISRLEGEFLSLSLHLALDLEVTSEGFTQVLYDYFCSSVKPKLSKCICQIRGLYIASNKSADSNRKKKKIEYCTRFFAATSVSSAYSGLMCQWVDVCFRSSKWRWKHWMT